MACSFCQTEHMEETFLVNSALVFSYADFRDRENAFLLRFNFHRVETKPLNVREIVLTRVDTAPLNHIFWLKASFCKKKKKKKPQALHLVTIKTGRTGSIWEMGGFKVSASLESFF